MPLTPSEQNKLTEFLGTIETALYQREAFNGLAAIRDAALCRCTIGYSVAKDLNIATLINDDVRFYNDAHAVIVSERDRK